MNARNHFVWRAWFFTVFFSAGFPRLPLQIWRAIATSRPYHAGGHILFERLGSGKFERMLLVLFMFFANNFLKLG